MAIERIVDYRPIMPAPRSRRERDQKKQRKQERDRTPVPREHHIDERA
jgi:hypothetical protein